MGVRAQNAYLVWDESLDHLENTRKQEIHGVHKWGSMVLTLVFIGLHELVKTGQGARPSCWFWGAEKDVNLVDNLGPLIGKVDLDNRAHAYSELDSKHFGSFDSSLDDVFPDQALVL